MRTKRIISILSVIFALSINFSGCEQEDLNFYIDCDYCRETIPEYDTLWVYFTINDENPFVAYELHTGDYENGEFDYADTAWSDTILISQSLVNQTYSIKASYKVNGEPVYAIDGDKMQVVDGEEECLPPCYYIRGGTLDVRLK